MIHMSETPGLNKKNAEEFERLVSENLAKNISKKEYEKAYNDYKNILFESIMCDEIIDKICSRIEKAINNKTIIIER